jgi:hypothetical protein
VFLDELSAGLTPGGIGPLLNRFAVPHVGNDKSGQDYSELGILIPDGIADLSGRTASSTQAIGGTDTLSVTLEEAVIDYNEIATYDTVRISLAESVALFNNIAVTDAINVSLSETLSLQQSSVALKTATDTVSVSVSDAAVLNVSLAVTDTVSVSLTDTAAVVVTSEVLTASDTLSVSLEDEALLNIFAGVVNLNATDVCAVTLGGESAAVSQMGRVSRISLSIAAPRIHLEIT